MLTSKFNDLLTHWRDGDQTLMDGEELCILPSSFQSGVHGGQDGTVCEFLLVFGTLFSALWGATLHAFKGAEVVCIKHSKLPWPSPFNKWSLCPWNSNEAREAKMTGPSACLQGAHCSKEARDRHRRFQVLSYGGSRGEGLLAEPEILVKEIMSG